MSNFVYLLCGVAAHIPHVHLKVSYSVCMSVPQRDLPPAESVVLTDDHKVTCLSDLRSSQETHAHRGISCPFSLFASSRFCSPSLLCSASFLFFALTHVSTQCLSLFTYHFFQNLYTFLPSHNSPLSSHFCAFLSLFLT